MTQRAVPRVADANDSIKGVTSQSGVAPFFDKNDNIHTKNTGQKLNPDGVIDGMWEDAPNTFKYTKKTDVEKSRVENVIAIILIKSKLKSNVEAG